MKFLVFDGIQKGEGVKELLKENHGKYSAPTFGGNIR